MRTIVGVSLSIHLTCHDSVCSTTHMNTTESIDSMTSGIVMFRGTPRHAYRDRDGNVWLNRGLFVPWLSKSPVGRNVAATFTESKGAAE